MKLSDLQNGSLCANNHLQMCFICTGNCGEIHHFRHIYSEDTQENVDKFNEINYGKPRIIETEKVVCTTGIAGLPDPIPGVIDISEEGCKKAFEELVEYFQNAPPPKSIREYMDEIQASWTPDFKAKILEVIKEMQKDVMIIESPKVPDITEVKEVPSKKYQPDVQLSGRELRRQRRKEQRKNKKP